MTLRTSLFPGWATASPQTRTHSFSPRGRLKTILCCFWARFAFLCVNTSSLASALHAGQDGGMPEKKVTTGHTREQAAWNLFDGATTFREGGRERGEEKDQEPPHPPPSLSSLMLLRERCALLLRTGDQFFARQLYFIKLTDAHEIKK